MRIPLCKRVGAVPVLMRTGFYAQQHGAQSMTALAVCIQGVRQGVDSRPGGCPLLMCMLLPASTQGVMQCLLGCERTCTGPWHVCLAMCQVRRHTSCASNMYIMMTWTSVHVMMTSRYDQGILCGQLLGEGHSAASCRWTPGVWLSRVRPADGSLPP